MLPQEGPPLHPALGHTPSWTSRDVLLWLKRAFNTNPLTRSAAEIRPLNWLNEYLDTTDPNWTRKRDILLLWAKCRAEGASFHEAIRGRPVKYGSPTTAYRYRDEAAEEIAAGINGAIERAHAALTTA